jgi:hypothetical protein
MDQSGIAKGWLVRTALLSVLVLMASVITAGLVDKSCTEAFPFAHPDIGTPRAGYCAAISGYSPWVLWILAPTAAMVAGGVLLRSHPWASYALAFIILVVVVANSVISGNLEYDALHGV